MGLSATRKNGVARFYTGGLVKQQFMSQNEAYENIRQRFQIPELQLSP